MIAKQIQQQMGLKESLYPLRWEEKGKAGWGKILQLPWQHSTLQPPLTRHSILPVYPETDTLVMVNEKNLRGTSKGIEA